MNDYAVSALLGIVEGLTEFLPVSSTAHLRVVEALLGIDLAAGYWKMYTVVIQLGAILALPIYFRKRIAEFLRSFPGVSPWMHPLTLTLIAFAFTAVPAFLLVKVIGKNLESLYVMGSSLVIGGVIMWVVDAVYGRDARVRTPTLESMMPGQAVWIGCCQAVSAVFPGTSRSMATIAAGQLTGMSRSAALEFSFFLSMPTLMAATTYDLLKSLRPSDVPGAGGLGAVHMDQHGWIVLAIGFVVSFVVAYGVVAWFMWWVRSRGFLAFAIYRIVAGAAILWWARGL